MSKEIEATRKLFKTSKRLQKLMRKVQNQKIMKTPTAKQIIEQLDKINNELLIVEDFAIARSVYKVRLLFLKYAQQSPASGLNLKELERKLDKALEKETPKSLKEWLRLKRDSQSTVTDEQIESYARVICTVTFKNGSKVSPPKEIARCIKMGKLIRDLQPKTDDWVSAKQQNEGSEWTQEKVQKIFDELGFEMPQTEEQLRLFNEKFKDYPHKLTGKEIDPMEILNNIKKAQPPNTKNRKS